QGRVGAAGPADVSRDLKPVVRKYLGAQVGDAYVDNTRPNGTNEIVVRIRPDRWYSRDFGKSGGPGSAPQLERVDAPVGRPGGDQRRAAAGDRADRRIRVEGGGGDRLLAGV